MIRKSIYGVLFLGIALLLMPSFDVLAQRSGAKGASAKKGTGKLLYGTASFYSNSFNGRRTASGEIFSQAKLTCACNVVPLGTWLKVTNMHNGKSIVVKVNDRLHPKMKRLVDLTRSGAQKLGFVARGLARVKADVLGKQPSL